MRVPAAALAVLLLVAICSLAQADLRVSRSAGRPKNVVEGVCCYRLLSHPVPRRMILSVYRTSHMCPVEAVVLLTRHEKEMCVDPKAPWVQKYLEYFERLDF